jgi:putative acetyltransferase
LWLNDTTLSVETYIFTVASCLIDKSKGEFCKGTMSLIENDQVANGLNTARLLSDVKVRKATLNDLTQILELFVGTVRSTCANEYTPQQIQEWVNSALNIERWGGFIKEQFFILAESNRQLVGFASLADGNHVHLMYVHKDFLRRGVASALYNALKEYSEQLGYSRLTVDASITARPFFESRGLSVTKVNQKPIGGFDITNYSMSE